MKHPFNLTIFYGKDADWAMVINTCMRYPMFGERQVVLLKEAQQMKDIDRLENYVSRPLATTIFVVSYKEKKLDARTKFSKAVKQHGELFQQKKFTTINYRSGHNKLLKVLGYLSIILLCYYWLIILVMI